SGFQPYLSVINNPEEKGVACNFVSHQISLNGGGTCRLGLPNFIDCDMFSQVGLNENENTFFNVYPNPVSNQLAVNSDRESEFVLNSMSGQFIQSGKFQTGMNYLDLSTISSGVYLLKFQTTEGETKV